MRRANGDDRKSDVRGETDPRHERQEEQDEDAAGRRGPERQPHPTYPTDLGVAYESEPEPASETFSEPEHWLRRGRRQ